MKATPQITVRGVAAVTVLLLLALVPQILSPFYINVYTRIMIWAIGAVSLNLILGYGGMISFGHAAYLGVAAYIILIMHRAGIDNGFAQWPLAIVASGIAALIIGAFCLRTRGLYFIMITLAFTQMLYFFFRSLDRYGGDDGMPVRTRSEFDFGWFELALKDRVTFYYVVFVLLLASIFFISRVVNSRFGMVLQGSMLNDTRLQAIGVPSYRYRLTAFVIAGMMGGLAGILMANMEKFVSSETLNWIVSGDLIFIVVLGGTGRLFGPVFGAVAFFLLQELLRDIDRHLIPMFDASWLMEYLEAQWASIAWQDNLESGLEYFSGHWKVMFGPILILIVLFARGGVDGILEAVDHRLRARSRRDGTAS